jgi:hypothetical protein
MVEAVVGIILFQLFVTTQLDVLEAVPMKLIDTAKNLAIYTTPYHPLTDGLVEQFHSTLKLLRKREG